MIPFISLLLINKFGVSASKALSYARLIALGLAILGLIAVLAFFSWTFEACNSRKAEKERQRIEANLSNLGLQQPVLRQNVNEAKSAVENAEKDAQNARNRPINTYNGNAQDALKRYRCEIEGDCK